MINIEHITKIYNERIAAKDITFTLEKGSICGFLGPNGAGKSTTMNMISGYLAPSDGKITIEDIDMIKSPEKAKKLLGYLPEIPPLYPDMTVEEYLDFAADLKGIKKTEKQAEIQRVIAKTALEDVSERIIKNLSKGYKQRVGMAQALLGNPYLLILDEPTAGLDPKQIVEIRNLLLDLKNDHAIILSTHILSEASSVCDRMLIISHGHIVADDTPENLVNTYNKNQTIRLSCKANSSNVEVMLSKIEGIKEYQITGEESGHCNFKIIAEEGCDLRESLSEKCTENNFTILEITPEYISLEDIYLKLTSEEYYHDLLLVGEKID